jgi:SAM-dependent methyltransferase
VNSNSGRAGENETLPAGLDAPRTFRDPDGFVFVEHDRVFRAVRRDAFVRLGEFLGSETGRRLVETGRVVRTLPGEAGMAAGMQLASGEWEVVEHERVFFPSYPSEWPPEMLHESGRLTLELARECLAAGFGLKDATPYNTLFNGPRAVFVDVLSFEQREALDPLWAPYAQFVRTYLLPLAAERLGVLSLQRTFLTSRDGLEPREVYSAVPGWRRLLPPYLSLVTLPVLGEGRARKATDLYRSRRMGDAESARFVMRSLLGRLQRQLDGLRPSARRSSTWRDYEATRTHYPAELTAAKEEFVSQVLRDSRPETVLDVGANAGEYSAIAARAGAKVVAIDSDAAVVGEAWRRANAERLDILPLVVDFSRPTPGVGWRNREGASFLARAEGRFDTVMMLAVVHHLLVTERIPLEEILDLAAALTRDVLILEYVEPGDPMFQRLARGRDALYAHLTREYFEAQCGPRFEIARRLPLEGSQRTLYALRRRP